MSLYTALFRRFFNNSHSHTVTLHFTLFFYPAWLALCVYDCMVLSFLSFLYFILNHLSLALSLDFVSFCFSMCVSPCISAHRSLSLHQKYQSCLYTQFTLSLIACYHRKLLTVRCLKNREQCQAERKL